MFDSLSDKIKEDESKETKTTERIVRWASVVVISALLFGGLYFVVQTLE